MKNLKKLSRISGIYKIISPSGKIYIGQSVNLFKRLKSYFEPNSAKNQTILKHSFDKYSRENHIFSIIEECEINLLNERERYWQEQYKDKLLNCRLTETSDKSGICSEQTKVNISVGLKRSGKSYQHLKRKIYQYDAKGVFIKEWESLRIASRELNIQSSQISRSTKRDSNNLDNDLIREWESVTLAAKETNTSKASIIRCCKDRQRTANGFIWSY